MMNTVKHEINKFVDLFMTDAYKGTPWDVGCLEGYTAPSYADGYTYIIRIYHRQGTQSYMHLEKDPWKVVHVKGHSHMVPYRDNDAGRCPTRCKVLTPNGYMRSLCRAFLSSFL
jgi:hypothetical protein